MKGDILEILLILPGILLGLTFHEYAHALVADRLGDKTPRFQGRLTLNPFAHIDPIGFIMFLIFKFGWAKPVQTNPSAYKHLYKDDLKVSLAGPLTNLVVALFSAVILVLFSKLAQGMNMNPSLEGIIGTMLYLSVYMNCVLFILNLIPIPGFDGFHILRDLFPKFFYKISDAVYRYQFIIMIIFLVSPLSKIIVGAPAEFIVDKIFNLVDLI